MSSKFVYTISALRFIFTLIDTVIINFIVVISINVRSSNQYYERLFSLYTPVHVLTLADVRRIAIYLHGLLLEMCHVQTTYRFSTNLT